MEVVWSKILLQNYQDAKVLHWTKFSLEPGLNSCQKKKKTNHS